jgi:aconitate hydratase
MAMLIPEVVGFELTGKLPTGATATDLVLTVTRCCARRAWSASSSSSSAPACRALPLTDRATIANMAPEYGATMGFFPVDAETLAYLRADRPQRGPGPARRGATARSTSWHDPSAGASSRRR